MPETPEAVWAIVELMGHVKLAGRLTEEEKFGAKMGRIDIPIDPPPLLDCDPEFVTQWFGGNSVYRITIVTEQVARDVAKKSRPEPVSPWDYPKQLAPVTEYRNREDVDYDDAHPNDRGDEGSDLE